MKRLFSCLLALFVTASLCLAVKAEFLNPSITDNAGYLTLSEERELSKKLDEVREKHDFEVAIYIENTKSSVTAESSADDIYDYKGYGAGENDDGIMLYICADTREYHFTTHAKGIEYFNSNGLEYLENAVVPYLSKDEYYDAFEAYISCADELLCMAKDGRIYNEKNHSIKYLVGVIVVCLIAPLIVAYWLMQRKLKKMKTAVENNYAENYIKQGSMDLKVSKDLFLYSRITKSEKAKSSSGTHTSSSGRTHGGSGGSF